MRVGCDTHARTANRHCGEYPYGRGIVRRLEIIWEQEANRDTASTIIYYALSHTPVFWSLGLEYIFHYILYPVMGDMGTAGYSGIYSGI